MGFRKFFNRFLLCLGFIVAMQTVSFGNSQQEISLVINGVKVEGMESPPVILSGHTMVPARDILEPVGAVISWNTSTQSVYIALEEDLIILEINNDVASFNSSRISMASPARIINDRTMIPVRFVAETLGFDVTWDESTRIVYIDMPEILEPDYELENSTNDFIVIDSQNGSDLEQDQSLNNIENPIIIHDDESDEDDLYEDKIGIQNELEDEVEVENQEQPQQTRPEIPVIDDEGIHSLGQISSINFPLTRIINMHIPQDNQAHFFIVEASSEISAANYFMVENDRLVIDIHNANMHISDANNVEIDNSPNVSRIRLAQNNVSPAISRVVFELIGQPEYNIFLSEDRRRIYVSFGENIVIDGNDISEQDTQKDVEIIDIIDGQRIVVLDPGHGGRYPGTVHFGVVEKEVALIISNMVRDMLLQNPDIHVLTTRDTDIHVPLIERAEIANNADADLFVSIHLNAVANNSIVRGTETYYLASETDANFNVTRREVAEIFQRNLIQGLGTIDRGVRTENFSVLRNTTMPSILLELGFLTNPQEAAMFAELATQKKSAEIIYASILEVFELCEQRLKD